MRLSSLLIALVLACNLVVVSSFTPYTRTVRYDGHKVYRCSQAVVEAGNLYSYFTEDAGLDVWSIKVNGDIDVRLTTEQQSDQALMDHLTYCQVIVEDVESLVVEHERSMVSNMNNADWFDSYHNYDEIVQYYQLLATQYPSLVTYVPSIGTSIEGRNQPAIKFTGAATNGTKMAMYHQCQIHAREWISGAVCAYWVNYLLSNYGTDQTVTKLLDNLEFHVVPFTNPDGYAYTWTNDRLWRKNRNPNGGLCRGVDINRNYDDHWAGGGSSSNPCSETYHGRAANSEPETLNTIKYWRTIGAIIGAIDWHSYSQLVLRPYGWTRVDCPDEAWLKVVGDNVATAIRRVHGVSYTSDKSVGLYVTTGAASDWFYSPDATNGNGGYRAAGFTIELRDTGRYGFELPPSQIKPTGEEIVAAVLSFSSDLLQKPIRISQEI